MLQENLKAPISDNSKSVRQVLEKQKVCD